MAVIPSENCYVALLSLAEGFRTTQPPDMESCLQCLLAILNIHTHPRNIAKTHLQIGHLFLLHTSNLDLAQNHLEKAWHIAQTVPDGDDIKLEAASLLSATYEKLNQPQASKNLLRKGLEESAHNVYWHCKLLFQLAHSHAEERDYFTASGILSSGADYANQAGAQYTRILFIISKGYVIEILPLNGNGFNCSFLSLLV